MTWWTYANLARASSGSWAAAPTDIDAPVPTAGVSIDSREDICGRVFVALRGEQHDGHRYLRDAAEAGASMCIIERGADLTGMPSEIPALAVADTRIALGDLARSYRAACRDLKVFAVTGSNGKTTTCRILHSVLCQRWSGTCSRKSFNNDIGLPLTILNAGEGDDFLVCEIGSNAPGEIAALSRIAQPNDAIITCIGRAHMEGLGGRDGIAREKAAITAGMSAGGLLLFRDLDDEVPAHTQVPTQHERFGAGPTTDHRIEGLATTDSGQSTVFSLHGERYRLPLAGEHNAWNTSAVVALARRYGFSPEEIRSGLSAVSAPPMRSETAEYGGVFVVNDAYNANPDSVRASLDTFVGLTHAAERRLFVLGDMLELGKEEAREHEDLGREIVRTGEIDVFITVGRLARLAARSAKEESGRLSCIEFDELTEDACTRLASQLHEGDAVLLKGSRAMRLERISQAIRTQRTPIDTSAAVN